MTLNFALCTDENFVIPSLVCITSIFENNIDEECHVYILTEGLSKTAYLKFEELATIYSQSIIVKTINSNQFKGLIEYGRFPLSMYFRFLLPQELDKCDTVLYLDCDVIVRHPLKQVYQTDLNGYACAVVADQNSDDVLLQNRVKISSQYFNSGVMLINLNYWRIHKIANILIQYIKEHPHKCVFPDQDALNIVLENKVVYLDYTYNLQELWLTERDNVKFHFSKWPELDKACIDPVIVHYCVINKPWFVECINPFKKDFLFYASKYRFIGFKLRKRRSIRYYLYKKLILYRNRLLRLTCNFRI